MALLVTNPFCLWVSEKAFISPFFLKDTFAGHRIADGYIYIYIILFYLFIYFDCAGSSLTSLVAQTVKHLSTMRETWVRSLGRENPLEKEMAVHSSTIAWKSHGQRSLVGYSPWGRKESDTTERLHFHSLSLGLHCCLGFSLVAERGTALWLWCAGFLLQCLSCCGAGSRVHQL